MQLCSLTSSVIEVEKKNDISEELTKAAIPKFVAPPSDIKSVKINEVGNKLVETEIVEKKINSNISSVTATTAVKKPVIKHATPSITAHLNIDKKQEQAIPVAPNDLLNTESQKKSLTIQAICEKWDKYAQDLKMKGKSNLGIALLNKRPVLIDDVTIEFSVTNEALKEAINEDKLNFLGYLRRELNNFSIQLNLVMTVVEDKTNLYTATDRYNRLAEKNPMIKKFRQSFDLDIEF
jgi:DNA polymerase-3 subunit gamma/tau